MPRYSERQLILRHGPVLCLILGFSERLRSMYHDDLSPRDAECLPQHALGPLVMLQLLACITATRYLAPRLYDIPKRASSLLFIYSLGAASFRQELRMSPAAFRALANMLPPLAVFSSKSNNSQATVK